MGLSGKIVLISDGGHPSAEALEARFLQEGATVVVNGKPGGDYSYDCAKPAGADALVAAVTAAHGRLDILLHNHNLVEAKDFFAATEEEVFRSLNYNLKSAFLLTQSAGRWMKDHGGGNILYLTSIHNEKPTGMDFAYGMAKGGLEMLAAETALDLGSYHVRVNVIRWGGIEGDDELFHSELSPLYDNMKLKILTGETGNYDQVAELAYFLSSDDCPPINGQSITVDGGFLRTYMIRYNYEEWEARQK
jgi:NAD(P)-dependent dehydrogenase (short-subunit alcohol dehydrogenase family)